MISASRLLISKLDIKFAKALATCDDIVWPFEDWEFIFHSTRLHFGFVSSQSMIRR
jgi:hypothetical protein